MVDAAGVSVPGLRYQALLMNGVLCGLAGAYRRWRKTRLSP